MQMKMINKWLERINNELELQKMNQQDIVTMRFTRAELVELRMILTTLLECLRGEMT